MFASSDGVLVFCPHPTREIAECQTNRCTVCKVVAAKWWWSAWSLMWRALAWEVNATQHLYYACGRFCPCKQE